MPHAVYMLMNIPHWLARLGANEDLNFLLTNRIPRAWATRVMARLSRIRQPWVFRLLLMIWQRFTPLDLSDAADVPYRSVHEIFTRRLRPGARPLDLRRTVFTSPCDALVGACGVVADGQVLQAKGMPYEINELLGDAALARSMNGGTYVTLRLTAAMYHHFHAPWDCIVEDVRYHSGDTWNVNPIALKRIERLFCRNERAVLRCRFGDRPGTFVLVPVAAILVSSLRFTWLPSPLREAGRGLSVLPCSHHASKGEELGWFEHGSTVIVLVPPGFHLAPGLRDGSAIRMGQALLVASA